MEAAAYLKRSAQPETFLNKGYDCFVQFLCCLVAMKVLKLGTIKFHYEVVSFIPFYVRYCL